VVAVEEVVVEPTEPEGCEEGQKGETEARRKPKPDAKAEATGCQGRKPSRMPKAEAKPEPGQKPRKK